MVLGVADANHLNNALAAYGLQAEQPIKQEVVEIWHELWTPFQAAKRLMGQWALTPAGHCMGFRMEAIDVVLRALRIPARERLVVLDDVLAIGVACAGHMNDMKS